ncbi:MAG: GTP cyclohydrolase I FolE2 [Betaproteobacteria bacterium]|nr:GTP cyclohydrolase I FolE2 [Betaproteobacteria bacterium]NBT74955.1 GTP cyclohydrolase I FolE2 [Betaproteobacteria bacterium]NCA15686.1 GTP cyclohydrolase I FolE2 [Betaproteobacteria bacterium]NDF03813.1 GTP cyclohydrolase I FolE2 [Betaproteobacteria bacterium]
MNAPEKIHHPSLPDVQSVQDTRELPIQRVGIKSMRHPVHINTPHGPMASVAMVDMMVALPADKKGTHMSRFLEVFQAHDAPLDADILHALMHVMLDRLEADEGYFRISLPYFVRKAAPVSGVISLMDYEVIWEVERKAGSERLSLTTVVPVTSLCPCSKKISDYGAHNQRSHVTITADLSSGMSPETLIQIAEQSASCELWGLLKRPDEKYVTERAYDNPKFVEDLVRDVAIRVAADPRVLGFTVESENFESIHNHSAYARINQGSRSNA